MKLTFSKMKDPDPDDIPSVSVVYFGKATYFISGADVAYSFPMVEMAGEEHYEFISNILLVYNGDNPRNDHKQGSASGGPHEQFRTHQIISSRPKYQKL